MTTKMTKLALALGAMAFAGGAMAAEATGAGEAKVITPISVAHDAGAKLNFGSFSTTATGQTVVVTAAGGVTRTGVLGSVTSGATPTADAFTISGEGAYSFVLTMPSGFDVKKDGTGTGTGAMAVSALTIAPVGASAAFVGTGPTYTSTLTAGEHKFTVGGTLTTVASQLTGTYTGSYTVTVEYN